MVILNGICANVADLHVQLTGSAPALEVQLMTVHLTHTLVGGATDLRP